LAPFERPKGESPYAVHRDLQQVMQNLVGIFRVEDDLKKALIELEKLKERAREVSIEGTRMFNPGWHLCRDLKSMLIVSEAVARSARARKESRGAHSRIDFPNLDAEWGKKNQIVARDSGGAMALHEVPVAEMPAELQQLLAEEK